MRRISFIAMAVAVAVAVALLLLLFFFFSSDSIEDDQAPPYPQHWLKALFTNAQSYLFPHNLDFRGSISNDEEEVSPGDKVKEAVAKSLGKCKSTVEESAKSAANKLKNTLSSASHNDL